MLEKKLSSADCHPVSVPLYPAPQPCSLCVCVGVLALSPCVEMVDGEVSPWSNIAPGQRASGEIGHR